jgi:hypothetical protein
MNEGRKAAFRQANLYIPARNEFIPSSNESIPRGNESPFLAMNCLPRQRIDILPLWPTETLPEFTRFAAIARAGALRY